MLSTTAFLAVAMQCAAAVHPSTSLDVARVESGFNPYAIAEIVPGSKRVISHHPQTKGEALAITDRLAANGHRYSVGLMQITSTNFTRYGVTAVQLLDPCTNLKVYQKILTDCYRRGGTLKRALSCYYSGNFESGQKTEAAFSQTSYVQRIGYTPPAGDVVVPGTREDRQKTEPESLAPVAESPVFETWDVLHEYPRETHPSPLHTDIKENSNEKAENPA